MQLLFKKYSIVLYSIIIAMLTIPLSILLDYKIANKYHESSVEHISGMVSKELASLETILISFESVLDSTKPYKEIVFFEHILKHFPFIETFIEIEQTNNENKPAFLIKMVQPETPINTKLLGLDIYSDPVFSSLIKKVIKTGNILASLVHNPTSEEPRIWLFKANTSERLVAIKLNVNKLMALSSGPTFSFTAHLGNYEDSFEKNGLVNTITAYDQKYNLYFSAKKDGSPINVWRLMFIWVLFSVLSFLILRLLKKRKQAEDKLIVSQDRFTKIAQATPIGIFQTDTKGNYIFTNDAYQHITHTVGLDLKESDKNHIYPADIQKVSDEWRNSVKEKRDFDLSYRHSLPNNNFKWVHCKVKAERDKNNKILSYIGTIEDITKQKQAEETIYQQANFDNLTNLANRFLILNTLDDLLHKTIRNNTRSALLFLDLDGFKKVNDTLGHEAGDEILIETAFRLKETVRAEDTIGRLGGDEFLILIDEINDISDILFMVEKIIQQFNKPFTVRGHEVIVTTSIGISLFPDDSKDASELLRHADMAMYHAKELGSNTYAFFTEKLNKNKARWLEIDKQLHGALDKGEFSVVYQPKINLATGNIVGAEALIRWYNPSLGHISPVEFIPIAEKSDIIIKIGNFVLHESLSITQKWHAKFGKNFQIAVNLSPKQFRDKNLIQMIVDALDKYKISPCNLELEITKGVLLNNHLDIKDKLLEISTLGVSLAIDDFGTGYSSLNYLRNYSFNTLKIDRSFINAMEVNSPDSDIVYASIAMAHALKLKVVAEGIETQDQHSLIKKYNCDYGQGFLFDKPVSFQEMVTKWQDYHFTLPQEKL